MLELDIRYWIVKFDNFPLDGIGCFHEIWSVVDDGREAVLSSFIFVGAIEKKINSNHRLKNTI